MFDLEALKQEAALAEFGASEVRDGVATIEGQPVALADLDQNRLSAAVLSRAVPQIVGAIEWAVSAARKSIAQATPEEMSAWSTKAAAARAFAAGGAPAPILTAEAEVTGETVATLAARIITNAEAFEGIEARLTGIRRKYSAEAREALTYDDARAALAVAQTALVALITPAA